MASNFHFNWDTSSDEDDFEGFSPEDVPNSDGSDIEFDGDSWSSDDEAPLADIVPLRALIPTPAVVDPPGSGVNRRWSNTLSPIVMEDFVEPPGPTTTLSADSREIDFFHLLFTTSLYDLIAEETNRYALQKIAVKPDANWTPATSEEIKTFIGVVIFMSIIELPNYKLYWASDWLYKTSLPSIMTRLRYEKLSQYLHMSNSTANPARGVDGHDRLHHIRRVMTIIQRNISSQYKPSREVAIDEAMIAYKGRLSFKQYMPAKPVKFGVKVWERADSLNGYVDQLQVYTGKAGNTGQREMGLAARVVTDLTRDIVGSYRHLYVDNYFTSPALFDALLADGIYACGTCRVNRKGFPSAIAHSTIKKKGDFAMVQCENMVATAWYDNKPVTFLSTSADPTQYVEVKRKNKDGTDRIQLAPEVIRKYSANMNGVDRADQMRMQYSCGRKSLRWWKYVFHFLLDTAIVNSFILMKCSPNHIIKTRTGKTRARTQLEYRQELSKLLIGETVLSRKRKASITANVDRAGNRHWPAKMQKGRCRQCVKSGIRREPQYGCGQCAVRLCIECFEPFHRALFLQQNQEEEE